VIDFHCHLDLYPDVARVVAECKAREIYVLSVTTTPSAWAGTTALSKACPRIKTALGLHPQLAFQRKSELALFEKLILETRYVGEVGLDGAPDLRPHWDDQIMVFKRVLACCERHGGRLISVHSRRAARQVLDVLSGYPRAGSVIFRDLDRSIEMGCWFSVGPAMMAGQRGQALAARMPRDRVLTETDGPFAQLEGRSAFPWDAINAVEGLAAIWGISASDAEQAVDENLRRLVQVC
jgi:TatD DNase family protein